MGPFVVNRREYADPLHTATRWPRAVGGQRWTCSSKMTGTWGPYHADEMWTTGLKHSGGFEAGT